MSDTEWITSSTGKRYRLEDRDGVLARVYESGVVKNDKTGKILQPVPGTQWDSKTGTDAINTKHAKSKAAMELGLIEAAQLQGISTVDGPNVAGIMARGLASDVLNGEGTLRDRTMTTKTLLQMADLIPSQSQQPNQLPPGAGATLIMSDDMVQALIDKMVEAKLV